MTTFSDFLRQRMTDMNLNNKGVASLAGVSPSVVGDWLKGTLPRAETLLQLADTLQADAGYLFHLAYGLPLSGTEDVPDPEIDRLMRKLEGMPEDERAQAEAYIDFLLARARKEKNETVGVDKAKAKT